VLTEAGPSGGGDTLVIRVGPGEHGPTSTSGGIAIADVGGLAAAIADRPAAAFVGLLGPGDDGGHIASGARALAAAPDCDVAWFDFAVTGEVFEPWTMPEATNDVRRELIFGAPLPLGALVLRRRVAERLARASTFTTFRAPGVHRGALLEALATGGRAVRGAGWARVAVDDGAAGWRPTMQQDEARRVAAAFATVRAASGAGQSLDAAERAVIEAPWARHDWRATTITRDGSRVVAGLARGRNAQLVGYEVTVALHLHRHGSALTGVTLDTFRKTTWYEFGWSRAAMGTLLGVLSKLRKKGLIAKSESR